MSSQNTFKLAKTKDAIAVYGYIRKNFEKKCLIDGIVATIIQIYITMIKGGSLYVCGDGKFGKLGIEENKNKKCKVPTLCPPFTNNNAYKVSAGSNHILIIDTEGDVWCCGRGEDGQLGNGQTNNLYIPTKLELGIRVIAVSAGSAHSLLLCENGALCGCGSNIDGQLGLGHLEKTLVPKAFEKLAKYKVVQICAGEFHSAALTENGELYCFGGNYCGQCGVGEYPVRVRNPTKVNVDDEIEFVQGSGVHTLIISRKGLFYSCGHGEYGRLGHGYEDEIYGDDDDQHTPKLIESLKEKRMIRCAAGYNHSLCIDKEGIIWSFGNNYRGQCGLSEDIKEQTTPTMIPWFIENNIKAKECFAGFDSSSIIAHNGSLYLFGSNREHQLGLKEAKNCVTPTELVCFQNMTVQSISMGYQHTAIICESTVNDK